MKKFTRIIGFIALVAVIGLSMAACDNGSGGGSALDGRWRNSSGWILNISGNSGSFSNIQEFNDSVWRDALNKGLIRNGGQTYRNLRQTDQDEWTGEALYLNYSGNTATGVRWGYCRLVLSYDGTSIREYYTMSSGGNYMTWNRM